MVVKRSLGIRKKTSKHFDFDYFWNRHQDTITLLARTLVKECGGHTDEYMGSIALTFNTFLIASRKYLRKYSDLKFRHSAFVFCLYYVKELFVKFESDLMSAEWVNFKNGLGSRSLNLSTFTEIKGNKVEVTTVSETVLKNIPCKKEELGWALDFVETVGGRVAMWNIIAARLPNRYKLIVQYRYILEMSLQEIGDIIGLSKERVRQIIVNALVIIRNTLRGNNKAYIHLFSEADVGFEY